MPKIPEAERQEILNLVVTAHSEAMRARTEQTQIESPFPGQAGWMLDNPWPIYDEFYKGLQWKRMGKMPRWKSCPTDNKCFQVCESMTTFITDNRAKAQFIPTEVDDSQFSDRIQATFNWWAGKDGYDIKAPLAVLDSRKFGVGWYYLKRDKRSPMGQTVMVVNPDAILVDPDCTAASWLSGDGPTYLIYEYMAQLGDLMESFPDVDWTSFDPRWMPSGDGIGMWDRVLKFVSQRDSGVKNPALSVPVYEMWCRDTSEIVFEEDLGRDHVAVKKKKKYPGGRRIIVAGGQVLRDEKNPYKHGEFPFTPILAYPESDKFYCSGDIEHILNMQVMVNRLHQTLYDSTIKSGGGIVITDPYYGITADMVTNDPVQIMEVTRPNGAAQALRMERFPDPPRHLFNHMATLNQSLDNVAGLHDISRGAYTPGNKTAQEIAALTASDQTRVRKAARWLAWVNERIARQWLSNAAQWSDWSVFVRVSGDDGDMTVQLNGDELRREGEDGKLSQEAIDFDVTVADFSMLPTYFQERRNMAMQLAQMVVPPGAVIDEQALLETLEFPGWKAIAARKAAAAQQQAQMAPPPEDAMHMPDGSMMPDSEMMQPDMGVPLGQDEMPIDPETAAIIGTLLGGGVM